MPLVDSVENELTTGQTTIVFGYVNTGSSTRAVPRSVNNAVFPDPRNRGQPTTFLSGTHHNAFTLQAPTYNSLGELEITGWRVFDLSATANPADGITFVRRVTVSTTHHDLYTHTSSSHPLPSPTLIVESQGTLVMESGVLETETITNRGTGTVRLEGGTLSASTGFTNSALLELVGGALSTPSFTNTGDGRIVATSGSNALADFTNSGRLTVQNGSLAVSTLVNEGLVAVTGGTLTISNGLRLEADGTLRLDGGTIHAQALDNYGGTLDLRAGTLRLNTNSLETDGARPLLGANPVINGPVTIELLNGDTYVATDTSLTVSNGATLSTRSALNRGTINIIAATLDIRDLRLENQGVLNLVDATIDGDVLSPAGSSVRVAGNVVFNGAFGGAANFSGTSTTVTFNGGYSPGDSPAFVTHEGDLVFGAENLLVMELAGLARGDEYDALVVGGALVFGGDLRVDLLEEFSPAAGDSFDLFDFDPGLSSGNFANLLLPNLGGGLAWDASLLYSSGVLSVVAIPEPASFATLLAAGACGAAFTRRRRR